MVGVNEFRRRGCSRASSLWEGVIFYLVDSANRIVDAGDGWDEAAAQAPGGLRAFREHIIGKPLESFIVGDATKMFVRACLDRARIQNTPRVLPYRCDSADGHRSFNMVITPLEEGLVRVEHVLCELRARQPRRVRAHGIAPNSDAKTGQLGWRCSQCLRVRLMGGDEWDTTPLDPDEMLAQDVCPRCSLRLFETESRV